jgi:transcriptional regulator with XRE-family HTH domain
LPKFEDVRELLCAARKRFGLSQEQFASALGVKVSRLQKWESGVNEPRFTIPELRRLRQFNRELFEALMSGFLPLEAPILLKLLTSTAHSRRTQAARRAEEGRS